jgi:DNA-binding NarL/FixJ family response regulator
VVGEASDGTVAVTLARQLCPDVVAIDLLMPQVDGIAATRLIRSETGGTQVVVMAGVDDDGPAVEALRAGATAYLPRETRTEVILETIRDASAGHVAMSSHTVARLLRNVDRRSALSERESEVLRRIAQGKMNKQIARELDIAESTVKSHVGSLLTKLRLDSRTQLALYAARTGLMVCDDDAAFG